jgi:hypothetical protein
MKSLRAIQWARAKLRSKISMPTIASERIRRTKADLSAASQRLVEIMHDLRFGLVEALVVRDGQPVFDRSQNLRDINLDSADTARSTLASVDYELKHQVTNSSTTWNGWETEPLNCLKSDTTCRSGWWCSN